MQATAERRHFQRQRTRLRPGKLFDRDGRFLADCQVFDRTAVGLRVRCADRSAFARAATLIDEREGRLLPVSLLWQRGVEAGLRLAGQPASLGRAQFLQAAGPYYRVGRPAGALAPARDASLQVGNIG